jgi:predicted kinase
VFFGMTASGKSFLAKAWARRQGFPYFNTDIIRKEIVAVEPERVFEQGLDKGVYSREFSRKTYDTLLACAERVFAETICRCVVLDGSFQAASERKRLIERMANVAQVFFILCRCSESLTRKRLRERLQDDKAVSDGNLDVYLKQKKCFDASAEIPSGWLLELDTSASLEYLIERLDHFLSSSDLSEEAGGTRPTNP